VPLDTPAVFGRTNRALPRRWHALAIPNEEAEAERMAAAAGSSPVDISASPAYWGRVVRGLDCPLIVRGRTDFEQATDEGQAFDLVQAHLVTVLSCAGRACIDFFALPIRRAIEEHQVEGALRAMEEARGDGLILHPTLLVQGPALAVRSVWQFHDAFEAVLCPVGEDLDQLAPLAADRRVGLCAIGPGASHAAVQAELRTVHSAEEMAAE